jgi:hypothetical protein
MVELFDDTDTNVLAACKPFRGKEGYYNANAAELNREAATLADVRLKYPYPPTSCEQATTIIQNIEDDIKDANEKIASSASNKVAKRYVDSFLTIQSEFKAWLNAKQCVAAALKQEDEVFNQQLQDALNQEKSSQDNGNSTNNWLIFGSLGILFVGAVVIIFKKTKK